MQKPYDVLAKGIVEGALSGPARCASSPQEDAMNYYQEGLKLWQERLQKAREEMRDEVRQEVRDEAMAPLLHQYGRKLGRKLTDAELRTLIARLDALGPVRLGDVVLDMDGAQLAAWLADPNAR